MDVNVRQLTIWHVNANDFAQRNDDNNIYATILYIIIYENMQDNVLSSIAIEH